MLSTETKRKNAERSRKWNAANPERIRKNSRVCLLKRYGLTPEQYDEMFKSQGSRCAICKSEDPQSIKGWHVDHDHIVGDVRGILCHHCNVMLGHAKDRVYNLISAAKYLIRN